MLLPVDESFAKSCGQVSPISLRVTSLKGEKTAKIVINKPFAFIGSNLNCDVNLPNPAVSKRHVYLQLIGGRLYCIDQASREGIFWGERQRLFGWLDAGQSLRVGPYEVMLVERAGAEDCPAREATNQGPIFVEAESPELPQGIMQITETLTFPLQRQLTIIGSSKYCHLELDHQEVSRVHASLLRTHDGRFWIIDLMSRTGVKVNGIRCLVSPISDGDVIKIGNYATTFRVKTPTRGNPPQPAIVEASMLAEASSERMPAKAEVHKPTESAPIKSEEVLAANASSPSISDVASICAAPPSETISTQTPAGPAQRGELIQPTPGMLVPTREGQLQKRRRRRAVKAQLAGPSTEMQLVTTILQQMQQMQQEMFTQVRISMEMISNYVEKMQAGQRESVRSELAELRQLSQELIDLKEQLRKPIMGVRAMVTRQSSALSKRQGWVGVRVAPPAHRLGSDSQRRKIPSQREEEKQREALAAEALGLEAEPAHAQVTAQASPAVDPVGAHSHAWITQRVASLERERQSRWQRVLAKILGR
jgi:pSer/pThr/pTyr-binding forkhead associated (FHA) protein